uniref:Uncharacterized protein n=1 Tax=Virus NIOZ-UU159 TaxID=2763270 RepID=A0A7S9XGZ1_9VIRU|nr:MAG: hypothetical protein NIOZUU159_00046 [Virus NIOZ-UU159]
MYFLHLSQYHSNFFFKHTLYNYFFSLSLSILLKFLLRLCNSYEIFDIEVATLTPYSSVKKLLNKLYKFSSVKSKSSSSSSSSSSSL